MTSYEKMSYDVLYEMQKDFNMLATKVNDALIPLCIEESYGRFIENTITDIHSYIIKVRNRISNLEQNVTSYMMREIDDSRDLFNKLDVEIEKRDIDLNQSVKGDKIIISDDIKSIVSKNQKDIKQKMGSIDSLKFDDNGNFATNKMENAIDQFWEIYNELKETIDKNISGDVCDDKNTFESNCKQKFIIEKDTDLVVKDEIDFIKNNRCKNILMNGLKDLKDICSVYLSKIRAINKKLRNSNNSYSESDKLKFIKFISNMNLIFKYEIERLIQYVGIMFNQLSAKIDQSKKIINYVINNSEYKDVVKESSMLGEDEIIPNDYIIF